MTQCEKCGNTIMEGATFCTNCGAPTPTNNMPNNNPTSPFNNPINQPTMQPNAQPTMQPNMQPTMAPGIQPVINDMQPSITSTMPNTLDGQNLAKEKKKLSIPIIAMSVVSVICLVVGIAGIVIGTSSNNDGGESGDSGGNNGGNSIITPPDTNGGGSVSTTTQVLVGKYELSIPNNFDYSSNIDTLTIVPSSQPTWAAQITYSEEATYSQWESRIDSIIANGEIETSGLTATGSYIEINGTKYPCLEAFDQSSDTYMTIVISKAGLYVLGASIFNKDGSKPAAENIKTVASILATAKQTKELDKSIHEDTTEQDIQKIQNKIFQSTTTE